MRFFEIVPFKMIVPAAASLAAVGIVILAATSSPTSIGAAPDAITSATVAPRPHPHCPPPPQPVVVEMPRPHPPTSK